MALLCGRDLRARFDQVVRELGEEGVALEEYARLAAWIRAGGLSWRTQGPATVRWLCAPGVLAGLLEQSRSHVEPSREERRESRPAPKRVGLTPAEWERLRPAWLAR